MMVNSALGKSCCQNLCSQLLIFLNGMGFCTPFLENRKTSFGIFVGLRLLMGFGVFPGGVVNSTSDLLFTAPSAHEVGLALGFVGSFGVWGFFLVVGGYSWMKWWFFNHVGCGVLCRRLSLRHSLSFRISRFLTDS